MSSTEYTDLVHRLERVERQNRHLRFAGVLLFMILGAFAVMGVSLGERVLNADAFTLTGPKGEPRAMLGMAPEEPMFILYDPAGNARLWMGVVDNTPGIVLFDEAGTAIWKAPASE